VIYELFRIPRIQATGTGTVYNSTIRMDGLYQQCRNAQQMTCIVPTVYSPCERKIKRGSNVDLHSKSNLGNNSESIVGASLESHSTPKGRSDGPTGLDALPYAHARSYSSRSLVVREVSQLASSEDCNALATIRRAPSAYYCLKPLQSDYSPDSAALLPEATSEERHALATICWTQGPDSVKPFQEESRAGRPVPNNH
jgi:hypothetical protein